MTTQQKAPSSDLQPVEYVLTLLARAVDDLDTARGTVGNVTDPQELWAVLRELRGQVQQAWSQLEGEVELLAHTAILDNGGEIEDEEGRTIHASWKASAKRWDGARLVPVVAARLADTWDGEPLAVHTEKVATVVAECLGGFAPSTQWRTTPLERMGLDPDDFRTSERGGIKVEEKRPKPNRKPIEEAA